MVDTVDTVMKDYALLVEQIVLEIETDLNNGTLFQEATSGDFDSLIKALEHANNKLLEVLEMGIDEEDFYTQIMIRVNNLIVELKELATPL